MGTISQLTVTNLAEVSVPGSYMVLTHPNETDGVHGQVRPINLSRDVPQLMRLLRLVFSPTLDADGRRALNALSSKPVTLLRLNRLAGGLTPGFVWEVDGTLVGNISIIPTQQRHRAIIANVAVHPDYRRQGIAFRLMNATLAYLRQQGVSMVMLQVDVSNTGARRLYEQFGFDWIGATQLWRATSSQWETVRDDSGVVIRPIKRGEHQQAYTVDTNCFARELNWPEPLQPNHYKHSWWQRISNLLNGKQFEAWVIPDAHDRPLAVGSISGEWGRPYHLAVRVPEVWREEMTRPLLAKLLRRLTYLRQRTIFIEHVDDDDVMQTLLRSAAFRPTRRLGTMKLIFDG
ncbi:MAG: GNAT family N-acetyltransferase [Anaerolineae bacterium]|nr:GNAT family N-acetyltransferase [Anaerolineae bacterium]MCO5205165.1 GNAT family N-acetyltransferase [Anaerolineae bacterium]